MRAGARGRKENYHLQASCESPFLTMPPQTRYQLRQMQMAGLATQLDEVTGPAVSSDSEVSNSVSTSSIPSLAWSTSSGTEATDEEYDGKVLSSQACRRKADIWPQAGISSPPSQTSDGSIEDAIVDENGSGKRAMHPVVSQFV